MSRAAVLAVLLVGCLVMTGCGSDDHAHETEQTAPTDTETQVQNMAETPEMPDYAKERAAEQIRQAQQAGQAQSQAQSGGH